jgi:DNA-directed RNA polymerase subunit RPC12/RpoP
VAIEHLEIRPGLDPQTIAHATLACSACDAPIAPPRRARVTDAIGCPYCGTGGLIRDFLSFATPGRPARVVVRIAARP